MTKLDHCNELRRRIWELDEQRTQLMLMAPEVRNETRLRALAGEIERLENEIKRVRAE